ncbi:unnamed protein product [Toxocara canis]|uniref:Uncharacterized protein n=1 Tax=Toxocara canis TaxID=6265 RepID=A0A183UAT7_TOXCA|nr:unnamed protein product [Toxocara canis]
MQSLGHTLKELNNQRILPGLLRFLLDLFTLMVPGLGGNSLCCIAGLHAALSLMVAGLCVFCLVIVSVEVLVGDEFSLKLHSPVELGEFADGLLGSSATDDASVARF